MPQNYLLKYTSNLVRSNFSIYLIARKYARFLSRYFLLEVGFNVLGKIQLNNMKGKTLLDCGSNDGTSIEMILQYFPNSQIIAFDPIIKIPITRSNVIFHNIALGSKQGNIIIYTPVISGKKLSQFSSTSKSQIRINLQNHLNISKRKLVFSQNLVKMSTIDSFEYDPFFIKVDVEGFELDVLRGANNTIKKFEPLVLVEINSLDRFCKIKKFFDNLKYELVDVRGVRKVRIKQSSGYMADVNNYVFAPRSFLRNLNLG